MTADAIHSSLLGTKELETLRVDGTVVSVLLGLVVGVVVADLPPEVTTALVGGAGAVIALLVRHMIKTMSILVSLATRRHIRKWAIEEGLDPEIEEARYLND